MPQAIIVELPGGGTVEFPAGTSPEVIQTALTTRFKTTGGPAPGEAPLTVERDPRNIGTGPITAADLEATQLGATPLESQRGRLQTEQMLGEGEGLIGSPLSVVGRAPGLIAKGMQWLAPKLMRESLGAQVAVRKRFPQLDLDAIALREGAVPGSAASKAAIDQAAREANIGIRQATEAADVTGVAPITAREIVSGLRPIYKQGVQARRPDVQQAVLDRVREIRAELQGGGLSQTGGQARKEILQQEGKAALGAGNPKDAAIAAQLANAERKAIVGTMRARPSGVAFALDKSQELKALQQMMVNASVRTPVLRNALASAAGSSVGGVGGAMAGGPLMAIPGAVLGGAATYAANRAVSSPVNLGRLANAFHQAQPTNERTRQALRSLLMALMSGAQPEDEPVTGTSVSGVTP